MAQKLLKDLSGNELIPLFAVGCSYDSDSGEKVLCADYDQKISVYTFRSQRTGRNFAFTEQYLIDFWRVYKRIPI